MTIALGVFCPHPPLLIPQVGGRELAKVEKTRKGLIKIAEKVKEAEPEVLVIISPHAPLFQEYFSLWELPWLRGDFGKFGARDVSMEFEIDLALAAEIAARERKLVRLDSIGKAARYCFYSVLDHGCMVPLFYFQEAGVEVPILPLGMSMLPFPDLYNFGILLREALEAQGRRAVIVASGDLSHSLTPSAPAGYNPQGEIFDRTLVDKLARLDLEGIAGMDPRLIEEAHQCGYNALAIMLGAFEGLDAQAAVLSYEGPFGVGYCNCLITTSGREDPERKLADKLTAVYRQLFAVQREGASEPVALAIEAVETYVTSGKIIEPRPSQLLGKKGGAFVSINKGGQLRGCIGTISATRSSLADEIIHCAIAAATEDPRFPPVREEELPYLTYSVDVLGEPERIASPAQLDPKRYGVIVKAGRRQGLLLPDLEGIDTVEEQLDIAKRKAGIGPDEEVELYRFQVVRYQ